MKVKEIEKPIVTRMTERGQITIPEQIRKRLGFGKGEYFAASGIDDLVILKRLETPAKELRDYARTLAKKKGVKKKDLEKMVEEVREKKWRKEYGGKRA
jgi:AbrB family looped-hinge helix DNA binding protein